MPNLEITYPTFPRSAPKPAIRGRRSDGSRLVDGAGAGQAIHEPDRRWDLLLVCVAGYILTAVGRIHQLFPVLGILRPAILTGAIAIVLYCLDRVEARRSNPWVFAPTKYVIALLLWMVLSLSAALVVSASFDLVFDNFAKTVLMFVVVAGTVRGIRDLERLTLVYLIGATVYAGCTAPYSISAVVTIGGWDACITTTPTTLPPSSSRPCPSACIFSMPVGERAAACSGSRSRGAHAGLVHTGSRGGFVALVAVGGTSCCATRPLRCAGVCGRRG